METKYQNGAWWITDAVANGNMDYDKKAQIAQDILSAYEEGR